ncbi:MAG: Multi-copper polyphenol oxidoreductase, laccase [Parcubacteria group bacterium GW2011_GWC2_38_7]|nr:MAG: Multi-copper polyphenol oxidoreductase, laccase [Parcubacteria group bacterium GW2011_GWC2_38_7]
MQLIWSEFSDLVVAGTSTKEEGNLSFKWKDPETEVTENIERSFAKLGFDLNNLITLNQPHGNNVVIVGVDSVGCGAKQRDWLIGYDGLVTNDPKVILGIETADCLPIFLFDPISKVIGLAHAGWRGVHTNIVSSLIETSLILGSKIENIRIAVGPHIQSCCFKVQNDVADQFKLLLSESVLEKEGRIYVDLQKVIVSQLKEKGIIDENILMSHECTCCLNDKYYSFRREKEACSGSMLSVIKLKV